MNTLGENTQNITSVSFSKRDKNMVAIGSQSGQLAVIDLEKKAVVSLTKEDYHQNRVSVLAFNEGDMLSSAGRDRDIHHLDLRCKVTRPTYSLIGHK